MADKNDAQEPKYVERALHDDGVPMLEGEGTPIKTGLPYHAKGPEDAADPGPKRGDYSRVAREGVHYTIVRDEHGNLKKVGQ